MLDVDGPKTPDIEEFSAHQHRAVGELRRLLVRAPARVANASRNAGAAPDRHRRWGPARDALWDFLVPWLDDSARVAIVGAGNGDDLPLRRIARRAGEVVLIDIDPRAPQGARRGPRRAERRKVTVIGHDVTRAEADRVALAASRDEEVDATSRLITGPDLPLPGAPYDLVVGDLPYSQLLYPALLDLGVDPQLRSATLARHAALLTRAVVARLHASASRVVHIHDPLAWWDGHEQSVALEEILALAVSAAPTPPWPSPPAASARPRATRAPPWPASASGPPPPPSGAGPSPPASTTSSAPRCSPALEGT